VTYNAGLMRWANITLYGLLLTKVNIFVSALMNPKNLDVIYPGVFKRNSHVIGALLGFKDMVLGFISVLIPCFHLGTALVLMHVITNHLEQAR